MRIGIQTWGSDGDIRPYFALANGLRRNGHDVTVCYTSADKTDYSALASKLDVKAINVFPNPVNDIHIIGQEITKTSNALKQCKLVFNNFFEPAVEEMHEAAKELCRNNDIVIGHSVQHTLYTAAEKYNKPRISVFLTPILVPSRYYPPMGSPDLGALLNSFQHFLGDMIGVKICFPSVNKLQSREGLVPVKRFSKEITLSKPLTLVASSPSLFSRAPDWDENIEICGFFNIPSNEDAFDIPPKLEDFIKADGPPVYVTMGSSDVFQPEENLSLCIEAIKLSKQRAIIQTKIDQNIQPYEEPNIFIVNKVPHQAVFPLCSAIVHHGGAGTTQSTLLAGRASLVVEHAFDQTFWAQQLNKIGVAGKMLHRRSLTPQKLADGINQIVNSSKHNEKAEEIGAKMKNENGVNMAVQLIEERFQTCISN